jgi:hypothetical protein
VEDTSITIDDLIDLGFPFDVVSAVEALTRNKAGGESREAYIKRVVEAGAIARAVKRADIADNSDPRRLVVLDTDTQLRLIHKYARDLAVLDRESNP